MQRTRQQVRIFTVWGWVALCTAIVAVSLIGVAAYDYLHLFPG